MINYSPGLLEILIADIPVHKDREHTYFDIADIGFKENIISRVYAYFLNPGHCPHTAKLFLNSLIELIKEKSGKTIRFKSYECITEQSTPSQKRIDIFINSEADKSCIYIENKVLHFLNNDLLDYWNLKSYNETNKIGILLTLKKENVPADVERKFFNITHKEWIDRIRIAGIPAGISPRRFVHITDFLDHMLFISETTTMNEQAKFYFEHTEKVKGAISTWDEAHKYVVGQLKLVADTLNWELYGNSEGWRHLWDSKNKRRFIMPLRSTTYWKHRTP